MIALVWNCRGIGRAATIRALQDHIKSLRLNLIFLSEIKCSDTAKIQAFVSRLKFTNHEFVPSHGLAGGLLLLWCGGLDVKVVFSNESVISCTLFNDPANFSWQLTCVYGLVIPSLRPRFWECINSIGNAFQGPWLITGDFNALLSSKDKCGGKPFSSSSNSGFQQMVDANDLIDLGFEGNPFKWTNKRTGSANI